MSNVYVYLNFMGNTLEVFQFYKSVFGGEFSVLQKFSDIKDLPGSEMMTEKEKEGIMHVALPILSSMILMGSDMVESMGHKMILGNNVYLTLNVDTKDEAEKYFHELSQGGVIEMSLQDMFWGAYYGSFTDKYGIKWMVNYEYSKK